MAKVEYAKDNAEKCRCGTCPVQTPSSCAKNLYEESRKSGDFPPPDRLAGLYCSVGKTSCPDLDFVNLCNCPACLVWGENGLASNHYCKSGSADKVG